VTHDAPHLCAHRPRRRGFTLIELMVALAAGLFVAMGALAIARSATKFFQAEGRIAGAQLAVTLGMNRLTGDLSRAGFLVTPNIQKDNRICGDKTSFTEGLKRLAAINITQGDAASAPPQSHLNNMAPDSLVLAGSFDTTEQFPIRYAGGTGPYTVNLQTGSGAFQRAYQASKAGSEGLADIFRVGRYLRLVGPANQELYGVIDTVDVTGDPPSDVTITLDKTPALPTAGPGQCGLLGLGNGWLVNPVSRVKYDVRSLKTNDAYKNLVASIAGTPDTLSGDADRTELVRVELDSTNTEIASTLELVAEYAVDLKFGMRATTGVTAGTNPTLDPRVAIGSTLTTTYDTTADVSVSATATPEHVRSVQVRLSTRARAPDRDTDLAAFDGLRPDGSVTRMLVIQGPPKSLYARVRNIYADVTLMNLAWVTW
jgi:prepilin-type N-terminal cleavage/methylation domain-containing protein